MAKKSMLTTSAAEAWFKPEERHVSGNSSGTQSQKNLAIAIAVVGVGIWLLVNSMVALAAGLILAFLVYNKARVTRRDTKVLYTLLTLITFALLSKIAFAAGLLAASTVLLVLVLILIWGAL